MSQETTPLARKAAQLGEKVLSEKDEVVGIAAISDHFIVATKQGKLYRVSKDDQDMVKLWVEIPV